MVTALMIAALAAAPEVEVSNTEDQPKWAVNVGLSSPTLALATFSTPAAPTSGVGLGGLGVLLIGSSGSTGSLGVERALSDHTTTSLGLGVSVNRMLGATPTGSYSLAVMPGFRWYSKRTFEGLWVGGNVGARAVWTDGPVKYGWKSIDADLLVGWSVRLGRLLVALSGGPTGGVSWATTTCPVNAQCIAPDTTSSTTTLGLKVALTAGLAF